MNFEKPKLKHNEFICYKKNHLTLIEIFFNSYFYIIIRVDGIEWVRGGASRLHIPWNMLQAFHVYQVTTSGPGGSTTTFVDIKLAGIIIPETTRFFARLLYRQPTYTFPVSAYVDVPTEYVGVSYTSVKGRLFGVVSGEKQVINMKEFNRTDVGAKLFHYAPHLFDETIPEI